MICCVVLPSMGFQRVLQEHSLICDCSLGFCQILCPLAFAFNPRAQQKRQSVVCYTVPSGALKAVKALDAGCRSHQDLVTLTMQDLIQGGYAILIQCWHVSDKSSSHASLQIR